MIDCRQRMNILRRLTLLTRDEDLAEDCLQTAFVRLEEYRGRAEVLNEAGFVAHAARNIAVDHARKARVRSISATGMEMLENFRDDQPLQDEVLVARERLDRACATLDTLPERTRTAFMMHRFSSAKYSDIAVHLGVSVSAVEKHIARASLALARSEEARPVEA